MKFRICEMGDVNKRIQVVIDTAFEGSTNKLADTLNVAPSVISGYTGKRQSKPSYDVIERLVANANISPEWLITGKGDMFRESNSVNGTYLENKEDYEVAKGLGMSLIPEYTDTFRGGEVGNMISTDTIKAYWALPNTKADMIIEVEGDSMSSSYPAGSKVAIRKIQFDRQYPTVNIPFGEVFAIVIDNDDDNYLTFIKRLRRHPDKSLQNKFWIAQSDNAAYDDFEIEISKVRHLFIAVASIKLTGY